MSTRDRADVAVYVRALYNGGTDQVMLNLIEEFLARGHSVALVVDVDNIYSPYRDRLPKAVQYIVLEAERPWARILKLYRFLLRERPRSLLCAGFFPNVFAIMARHLSGIDVRVVVTEHNTPTINRQLASAWQPRRWFLLFARLFYPHADAVVAVSNGTAADLADAIGIERGQVRCIYNPIVNSGLYQQSQEAVDDAWFTDSKVPVVIALGRLEPEKNFALLLHAFARVRAEMACRLVIFGDGSEREMLEALVSSLNLSDCVQLRHFVPNPHAYTAKAALLAASSICEGLSNVLVEAIALGTPVVSTDCPFGPREVLNAGEYGTLVPVGDARRLADAMLACLGNRPLPAPDAWLEQFTTRRSADRYLELLIPQAG